jgi:hypothetical protein
VIERQGEDGRYRLKVEAADVENADLIARNLFHQLRPLSPSEIVVEIVPMEGRGGEPRTVTWTRPQGTPIPREPTTTHGTSGADRRPIDPAGGTAR